MNFVRSHILVCTGTGCSSSNSPKIIEAFERELKAQGMEQEARVVKTGCFGLCAMGPVVLVYPEGAFYTHVTPDDAAEIVSEHIVKGRIVQRLLNKNGGGQGPAGDQQSGAQPYGQNALGDLFHGNAPPRSFG